MLLKSLFALFLLVQLANAALKLQMNSKGSKRMELLREGKFTEYHQWRLNHRKSLKQRYGQFAVGHSRVYDYQDWYYVVNVSVGTPPQNFRLLPDTAVSLSWLPDISTPIPARATSPWICDDKPCFRGNESSTYIQDGETYGRDSPGQSSGFLGIDTFRLGDSDIGQLVITNATFGQATSVDGFWDRREFDGVLGLAFESISYDYAEPIFKLAIDQNLVNKTIITMWIQKKGEGQVGERGGQLTFGDYDSEHCAPQDQIIYFPLSSMDQYLFDITGIQINDQQILKSYIVISDTTTPYIMVPTEVLQTLVKMYNATYVFEEGVYSVPCDTKLSFSILRDENTLTINEKYTIADSYPYDGRLCHLAFDTSDDSEHDLVVLGDPFNRAFCQVYDMRGGIGYSKSIEY